MKTLAIFIMSFICVMLNACQLSHEYSTNYGITLSEVDAFTQQEAQRFLREKHNITPDMYNDFLLNAAHGGCFYGDTALFLKAGANPNATDKRNDYLGKTILHWVCGGLNAGYERERYDGLIELVLGYGANINARTNEGATPLRYAQCSRNIAACKILMRHGANPYIKDNGGGTPIEYAAGRGDEEIVQILTSSTTVSPK